jgi:RHS repeat-associated protein
LISTTGSLASTLGVKNPYRYRGYRYDTETGLYYLQSRYYNPEWGRFVNADAIAGNDGELLSHNLYVYAQNNPVVKFDPSGFIWETIFDVVNIGISTAEFVKNPSLRNAAFLAWDIGAVVLPGVPGSYVGKGLNVAGKIDDISDTSKIANKISKASITTRRQAFRAAKRASGIPTSAQFKTHKFVHDIENRIVYEFNVAGKKKYIIEHLEDRFGRGPHFHGADDIKGSPFNKGRYNQYPGHFPENFSGYR